MNYLQHLIVSKGGGNLPKRLLQICRNFGFTSERSCQALQRLISITREYGCTPTLFITADLLDHYAGLIKKVCARQVEVGLHGHHHVDHSVMKCKIQRDEIAEGLRKFERIGIEVKGFRAPFLRFSENTNKAVKHNNLGWVSHTAVFHRQLMNQGESVIRENAQHLLGSFYTCKPTEELPSVPWWGRHCLEIPVSLPDDEILVDRCGVRDTDEIAHTMLSMLRNNRRNGELTNLLFHPERIDLFAPALNNVLTEAASSGDVWICSLDDISQWWHERAGCSFEIMEAGEGCYRVSVHGKDRASAILQRPGGVNELMSFAEDGSSILQSNLKPVVCILPGFCEKGAPCLSNEGFVVESATDPEGYSACLGGVCSKNRRMLLEELGRNRGPLLRFWRWPDRYSSAMTVSFDVDAITLWDFVRRVHHFWRIDDSS